MVNGVIEAHIEGMVNKTYRWFVPSQSNSGYYTMVTLKPGKLLTCSGDHCIAYTSKTGKACRHMEMVKELEVA
jgi:hypothetical protein